MTCRHCGSEDLMPVVDLGTSPPSNAYPPLGTDPATEVRLPLRVVVCRRCWLMQTEDVVGREALFTPDYAYFSSYSTSWLAHAERYVERMVGELRLGPADLVVEIASNDGYLLQFVRERGIGVLGVEPTADTAAVARERGVPTIERFFGRELGRELAESGPRPRLMVANNVLAHVPDIDDFVAGFAELLAPDGLATFEFPHLLVLLRDGLYDTIYHEHFSYLSLGTVQRVLEANGLRAVDVDELPTHGGSLRVHAVPAGSSRAASPRIAEIVERERAAGLFAPDGYGRLQDLADRTRTWLRELLEAEHEAGRTVMGYGAAAKGTTLLNHAGIDAALLCGVVDRNPAKQARQMPGTGIPIHSEGKLREVQPATILLLPWNLSAEIAEQLAYTRDWGARFAAPLPEGRVW
jgi:SAM-dependent methyltransferase